MRISLPRFCILLVTILLLPFAHGCGKTEGGSQPDTRETRAKTVKVSVVTVQPTPVRDILVLPGETRAWQDVLVAADTGGRVEWVGPREGDRIKKGQLLAKIDVASLKAALDRAKANLTLAQGLYHRRQKLFERKIINKEELDRSLASRNVAKENLRQAQVEYDRGFVRSPISGRVNYLHVDEGEFIDRGKPMVELVNVDKIEVNVNVPELDVRYLKKGQQTKVRIDAFPDRHLMGSIDFVAYKAAPATITFRVKVLIQNQKDDIRPGMIARVAFLRRVIPDALVAPLFALVDKGGERIVFVEQDGVAHSRTVTIGVIEGDRVQIAQGLQAGDRLIVKGQTEVEEGTRVTVQ
jgi:membrane fusion protein (multidrug efflux system)